MILRRLPDSRFSEILPAWKGATVILLGGGASLTMADFELARIAVRDGHAQAIAINDSYLAAPWAAVLYAADAHWHESHRLGVAKPTLGLSAEAVAILFRSFPGEKCSIENQRAGIVDDETHILRTFHGRGEHGYGISHDPQKLVTGRHSGYQAVNFAILAGAATILLLGYDGKPRASGETHWHGGHEHQSAASVWQEIQRSWTMGQNAIKASGVRVINCSPGTYIDTFEKMRLEDALGVTA